MVWQLWYEKALCKNHTFQINKQWRNPLKSVLFLSFGSAFNMLKLVTLFNELVDMNINNPTFTATAVIVVILYYFCHILCLQPSATLWTPSRRDCLNMCDNYCIFPLSMTIVFSPHLSVWPFGKTLLSFNMVGWHIVFFCAYPSQAGYMLLQTGMFRRLESGPTLPNLTVTLSFCSNWPDVNRCQKLQVLCQLFSPHLFTFLLWLLYMFHNWTALFASLVAMIGAVCFLRGDGTIVTNIWIKHWTTARADLINYLSLRLHFMFLQTCNMYTYST